MVPKYTILKQLIQNSREAQQLHKKGFTLLELIVGMSIMLIVGGLAMNAFVQSSTTFNKDKKSIDSSQNMSVILEMVGNDIRQAGENINENHFPTIEFKENTDTGSMGGSSKITVRKALTSPLTLCQTPFVPTTATSIVVADNLTATVNASANCGIGTSSSPISVYRIATTVTAPAPPTTTPVTPEPIITTYYPQATGIFNPYPTTPAPLALKLPLALRKVRDYRCNTDPNTTYDSTANTGTDFCDPVATNTKKLRIAVANTSGRLFIFNQTGEATVGTPDDTTVNAATVTTSTKKYQIMLGNSSATPPIPDQPTDVNAVANNASVRNSGAAYPIGSAIYVIEERVYTLNNKGQFQVSVDGGTPETLIKKIDKFRVSARIYTNSKDRIVNPTPTSNLCGTVAVPLAAQPTTATETSPKYICEFNYFTGTLTTDKADWKTLAGIKVELLAKYDGIGQNATATAADTEKLYTASEFFPRNVLSK
jgi:prepilin-type N-terminal cleavage/methylation domain-containing protein